MTQKNNNRILVWGLQTRLFHWLLLLVFTVSMSTGLMGDIDLMEWHLISGYCVLGLVVFRLLTGFFANDYGRFTRLALSPRSVIQYLRGTTTFIGHNPLGSWMVLLMLFALLLQSLSGLMTTDEIFTEGPWVAWADDKWISLASAIHTNSYRLLLLLVGLHVAAIIFYAVVRKNNLVLPMLTGKKEGKGDAQTAQPISLFRLVVLAAIGAAITWAVVTISL